MWNKNRKTLSAAAPYLDEALILYHQNNKVELLTAAARKFFKLGEDVTELSLYNLPSTPLTETLEAMLANNQKEAVVPFEERHFKLLLLSLDNSDVKLILIKDDGGQEKMLNMGKEFVGNASHELRTPITIIKGFTEFLLDTDEVDKETEKSILLKMKASCDRMEHLVNHLLRLTDLENCNADSFAEVDIHGLIEDISYQVISIYPEVRIEHLRTEEDAKAFIDSDLIELVLTNLFKNAVKYSREEKLITVKVEVLDEEIYIQIQDKGIGIPEKDLEKIFDRFYTVDKAHCRKLGGAVLAFPL